MIYNESYSDPFLNWKLDLIRGMINATPGYENIQIVFKFTPLDIEYFKPKTYNVDGGILDGDVWLFKYHYSIKDTEEGEAKLLAWHEMQKNLIKSVWIQAIDSFRTNLKRINDYE
jgi:hypothetical protein